MTAFIGRREIITLLGCAAAVAARGARSAARKPADHRRSGLGLCRMEPLGSALMQRLRELGCIENRTIAIEYRWTEGRDEHYAAMAAELVGMKVDIIVALGTPAIVAARKATAVIPIVFPIASDPVGDGLVTSLARPGGDVTGLSTSSPILPANGSKFCGRSSPVSADWRCWLTATIPWPSGTWVKSKPPLPSSASKSIHLMSRARTILRLPSPSSRAARRHFMSLAIPRFDNQVQINTLALAARLPTIYNFSANMSKPEVWFPME